MFTRLELSTFIMLGIVTLSVLFFGLTSCLTTKTLSSEVLKLQLTFGIDLGTPFDNVIPEEVTTVGIFFLNNYIYMFLKPTILALLSCNKRWLPI